MSQGVAQTVFHFPAIARLFHVNEVNHDEAAQVAQSHLASHLLSGLQIGSGGGLFNVAAANGTRRVHIDRDQGLGVVDHNRATTGQVDRAGIGRFNLVLNLKATEQRGIVAVALDPGGMLGHDVGHELVGLVKDVIGVDQDVADVIVKVVANGANHQAGLLIDQVGAFARFGRTVNGGPQLQEVVQVPLKFGRGAPNAGGSGNDGHAAWILQLVHCLFELGAVIAFNAATHPTAPRVVGHEHHVASGQGNKGREGRTLVAALFFFDLNDQLLAFSNHILNARLRGRYIAAEELFGDFFEG